MRLHARWWAVGCGALGALAITLVLFDASNLVRAPVVLTFLLLCPGLAVVRCLGIGDLAAEFGLAVALSLTLDGVVSLVQAYTELWSPTGGLLVIAGVTMVAVVVELLVRRPVNVGEPQ